MDDSLLHYAGDEACPRIHIENDAERVIPSAEPYPADVSNLSLRQLTPPHEIGSRFIQSPVALTH